MPTVEFIIPCYKERDNIALLHAAFVEAFANFNGTWSLLFVDDGSADGSFEAAALLAKNHSNIRVIQFSRNFGKEAAIYAGLDFSKADIIGIVDADLQQPPAIARQMVEQLLANASIDCIAAYQENRQEGALVGWLKRTFYKTFAWTANSDALPDASDFRVFRRNVANALLAMPEYYRFSKGMFAWVGFNVEPFPYTPDERAAGTTKWTLGALFRYAFEGLLSFTTRPLHFISLLGITVSAIAVVYFLVLLVKTLVQGVQTPGYASTFGLVLLMGGGQFLALGIIGEYLARTYIQGKHRPIYIVRQVAGFKDTPFEVQHHENNQTN